MTTKAVLGSRAPRQRRGRNALIGVSASSAALIGQDRPLRRKIIGGRSRRRRHQDAVGDQFGHALALVDQDAQPRRLMGLAKQRDFIDGVMKMHRAMHVGGAHQQRMDHGFSRRGEPGMQIERAELVHQEADGAAMHAVDRLARMHVPMQRLQHQSVAAERHHDIGVGGIVIAVKPRQLRQRLLGFRAGARDEGDPVISLGRGHGISRAHAGAREIGCGAKVVYTTWAVLVEIGYGNVRLRSGECKLSIIAIGYDYPARARTGRKHLVIPFAAPRLAPIAAALLAFSVVAGARAQDAPQPPEPQSTATPSGQKSGAAGGRGNAANPPAAAEQHRLPPDSTTKHTLALPGRTLAFTATAGSIRLFDDKGEPQADIAYTAYQLDGADARTRPVTFLFNGGPGASSAWLQLGCVGPWRLAINGDAAASSAPPDLQPNAETWLDFTDLVFIDPVGTGYSRFVATGEDVRKRLFSVDGDVNSIAVTIRRWLEKSDRLLSPKFVVGESYGGIRGPKIVRELQIQQGVGVKGLILLSPVLDFREFSGSSILQYVASLPTMAAVAREAKGPVTRANMADVESYARGDFLG